MVHAKSYGTLHLSETGAGAGAFKLLVHIYICIFKLLLHIYICIYITCTYLYMYI